MHMTVFVSVLSHVSCSVLWEPMGDGKRVISLAENHVLLWDLRESSTKATVRFIIFRIAVFHWSSLSSGATSTAYQWHKTQLSVPIRHYWDNPMSVDEYILASQCRICIKEKKIVPIYIYFQLLSWMKHIQKIYFDKCPFFFFSFRKWKHIVSSGLKKQKS